MKNIVFSLLLLFVFVGCGGGGSNSASDSSIHTQIEGETLTITEEGTLKGLSVKGADASTDITQIQFSKVTQEPSREIPSFVTKLSDFFVVEDGVDDEVFLRIPLKNLPKDIDLNHLYLYTLVRTAHRINPFWSPVLIDRNYVEKSDNEYLEFRLVGLKDNVYFIGRETVNSIVKKTDYKQKIYAPKNFPHITCKNILKDISNIQEENGMCMVQSESNTLWKNKTFKDTMVCTTDEDSDIKIFVHGFYHPVDTCSIDTSFTRWIGVTIEEMVSWIREAQKKLDAMGLEYDKKITMHIKNLDDCGAAVAYYEHNSRTMKIRDDNKYSNQVKGTIKHEYFHHAQYINTENKIDSYYCKDNNCNDSTSKGVYRYTAWLMEGSADWFADLYKIKKEVPIILESGLTNDTADFYKNIGGVRPEVYNTWKNNPYLRFYFFKMLSSECNSNKLFKNLFDEILNNKNFIKEDKSAINSLQTALNTSECNFNFLREKDNNLANVLLYYQYATAWQNDITLLDENEIKGTITFKKSKSYTNSLDENFKVPPYGVKSYIFKLSKLRKMTIDTTKNGLKYYLLAKSETGHVIDHSSELTIASSDKDREYFVVFVNDSEKDIKGEIEIKSSANIVPIKGSINLPNTAGDLNFVLLSKDTKSAFVLTKDYAEGNLYLYSYDISNPNAIKLLDTELLAGSNIRYVYEGIYLSKDGSKLYTLIDDHRHGENIFSIIDISNPFGLNILGTYTSEQKENYFSYNILSDIEGFSEDESKVYFSSYIKEFASSTPQQDMVYLDISDTSNMNLFSGGLNHTLAGHEPQSSANGVTVSVQDKKLMVEKN